MIQRAQEGRLVSGQGATCNQLDAIIAIDKDALLDQTILSNTQGEFTLRHSKRLMANAWKPNCWNSFLIQITLTRSTKYLRRCWPRCTHFVLCQGPTSPHVTLIQFYQKKETRKTTFAICQNNSRQTFYEKMTIIDMCAGMYVHNT